MRQQLASAAEGFGSANIGQLNSSQSEEDLPNLTHQATDLALDSQDVTTIRSNSQPSSSAQQRRRRQMENIRKARQISSNVSNEEKSKDEDVTMVENDDPHTPGDNTMDKNDEDERKDAMKIDDTEDKKLNPSEVSIYPHTISKKFFFCLSMV